MSEMQLTQEDKEEITKNINADDARELGKIISIFMRALDGLDVSGDDKITLLTNPRNILERTRYPTYTQLGLVVYLEIIYEQSGIKVYHTWASKLSEALISYKGKGREEYVEMNKAQTLLTQMYPVNQPQAVQQQQPQQKAHWWSRTPKPTEEKPTESIS